MASKRKIRYAVVGLGHIAQVAVLPAFRSTGNSELVALVSSDPAKHQQLADQYSVDQLYDYDGYDEMLKDGVDAVYIAVPNHLHKEYTVRALNGGVHVLCEKPMAVTEAECREMISAAKSNRRKLMIAYRLHFEKGNLEVIEASRDRLGELRFFSSEFAQDVAAENVRVTQPTSQGGGPVYDMGVYCINAARYLFRDEPVQVSATAANNGEPRFQNTEEMVSVTMRFPNERLASFIVSFGTADIGRYSLVGTKGSITVDPAYEYAEALAFTLKEGDKTRKRRFPKRDQFAAEILYFSDCVLKNREPEPSGWEGLADVRIVEAIHRSAREGKPVDIEPIPDKPRPSLEQEIHRPAHGMPDTVNVESPGGEAE